MQDLANDLDGRVNGLDDSVEGLTSEVTSLKLELATLVSAIRELQRESVREIVPPRRLLPAIEPPIKPSMIPGALVVAVAVGVLSWQLIVTPRAQSPTQPAVASATPVASPATTDTTADNASSTEPASPLRHAIYRGTLTIGSDRPGAHVFINRQPVGIAPVRVRNLRAGSHLVWVEREGYRRWTRVVTVPAEQVTRVEADLEPIATER